MFANDDLDSVEISGCPVGLDWAVMHEDGKVKIEETSQATVVVDFKDYKNEVLAFADEVEKFYKQCLPKTYFDEFARKGYDSFWNEWHKRKKAICEV